MDPKELQAKNLMKKWDEKPMYGKFPGHLDIGHLDIEQKFQWLKHSGLTGEKEGPDAQDQALNTRYYYKHIFKEGVTDKCRMCHSQPETVEHIISGCQHLAAEKYFNRQN